MLEYPEATLNNFTWYAKKSDAILNIVDQITMAATQPYRPPEKQLPLLHPDMPHQPALFADMEEELLHPIIRFSHRVSPNFRTKIIQAWEQMHPSLKTALCRRDVIFHVPLTALEYLDTVGTRTITASGFYHPPRREVVVPQLDVWAASVLVPKLRVVGTLYHEVGHAIDFTFGMLSAQPGFKAAYALDKNEIACDEPACKYFSYFLWTDNCAQEAFAETWAQQSLKAFPARENTFDEVFEKHFPNTWAWVNANVPSAATGFALPEKTINKPDLSERTPMENLEVQLDEEEFTHVLKCGVNPLRLNPSCATSLLDRCIAHGQIGRVREIILQLADHPLLKTGLFAEYHIAAIRRDMCKWRDVLTNAGVTDAETLFALATLEDV